MHRFLTLIVSSVFIFAARTASAHEAYLLSHQEFQDLSSGPQFNVLAVLENSAELKFFWGMSLLGLAFLVGVFFFGRSRLGEAGSAWLSKHASFGPLFLRLGAGGALSLGALSGKILGPEIHWGLPNVFPALVLAGLIGAMLLAGFRTRLAATIGFFLFIFLLIPNGAYLFSYFGYIGALGALMLGGGGRYSIDEVLKIKTAGFSFLPPFVRITYGLMLLYGALSIKFLTPALTLAIVENFGLTGGFFPHNPQLVVLGAALTELALALMIIIGFEYRLAIIASLGFAVAALLYLPEPAWPHLILFGVSFYLLVTPQKFTADAWIKKKLSSIL